MANNIKKSTIDRREPARTSRSLSNLRVGLQLLLSSRNAVSRRIYNYVYIMYSMHKTVNIFMYLLVPCVLQVLPRGTGTPTSGILQSTTKRHLVL